MPSRCGSAALKESRAIFWTHYARETCRSCNTFTFLVRGLAADHVTYVIVVSLFFLRPPLMFRNPAFYRRKVLVLKVSPVKSDKEKNLSLQRLSENNRKPRAGFAIPSSLPGFCSHVTVHTTSSISMKLGRTKVEWNLILVSLGYLVAALFIDVNG